MSKENAELIRRAYQTYASGDLDGMLELVDPDLEWTYLDPALERPTPQVCHGRQELEQVLRHWAEHGLRAELEEVTSVGALVMVGVRTPGVDVHHGWRGDDRAYSVFTVRGGGSWPCATAAIGRRPLRLPGSRHEPPIAAPGRPQRR